MTLKAFRSYLLLATALFAVQSFSTVAVADPAFPGAGQYPPHHPHPHPQPPPPQYPPQYPPPAPQPAPPVCQGNQQQAFAVIQTRVINGSLQIGRILNLIRYSGYTIESVSLAIRGSNGRVSLAVNGQITSAVINPAGVISLSPGYGAVIARNVNSVDVFVDGFADIDNVTVYMHSDCNNGGGYGEVTLQLPVAQRLISGARLDLSPYIDLNRFNGLRVVEVQINAASAFDSAGLDVLVNNCFVTGLGLNRVNQLFVVTPQNTIVGRDALSLVARGDVLLNNVTLRLAQTR